MAEPLRRGLHPAWHVIQAIAYTFAAFELQRRFWGDAAALGLAALLQLVAAGTRARPDAYRYTNLGALALALLVYGRFITQGLYVIRSFGEMAGDAAWAALSTGALALPWLFVIPVLAALPLRRSDAASLVVLLPMLGALRPYPALASGFGEEQAQNGARNLASALWDRMAGRSAPLPSLPPEAVVIVTPWVDGKAQKARCVAGDEVEPLGKQLQRPEGRGALVVDVAWQRLPGGYMVPGRDAPEREDCSASPTLLARTMGGTAVAPGWYAPRAADGALRFASAMASDEGVVELRAGWARGPELDSDAILASVRAGARHLMAGMDAQGKFSYIVEGPSGAKGKGYNYPRHAGTIWFLARAAAALEDEEIGAAADRAIDHAASLSSQAEDGRRYIVDPSRKDGRVWVGTTGLAVMGSAVRGTRPELTKGWLRHIAGAVDEEGRVRNEALAEDGSYLPSTQSAYGQGQGMLALAIGLRELGDKAPASLRPALDRAMGFLASGAYAGSAAPRVVGDEHWMCITVHALEGIYGPEHPGVRTAHNICAAYVARYGALPNLDGWRPHTGGSAGITEAFVAHAWDKDDARMRELGLAYGRVFLDSQYQPADAPFLGKPEALIGGYRSGPDALDVQIDTVQHTGCALLSLLAVIEGEDGPGRLP